MGYFSYTCAKCDKSILAPRNGYARFSRATLFFPDGTATSGTYDGYGRLEDVYDEEVSEQVEETLVDGRVVKLVHTHCVEKGDTFESLPENGGCPNQGVFFGCRELEDIFGAPDTRAL